MKIQTQTLVQDYDFDINKVRFNLDASIVNGKPKEALWTSSLKENNISEWVEFIKYEDFKVKPCLYVLEPKADVKLYHIDSINDIKSIPVLTDWREIVTIDYKELQRQGYDGVNLTSKGNLTIKSFWYYTGFNSSEDLRSLLIGMTSWDTESTVWFNTNWIKSFRLKRNDLKELRLDSNY